MKLSLLSFLAVTGTTLASSNPFAPKVTPSNPTSAYTAKLVRGARTLRSLEGQQQEDDGEIDLTNYSIKFEKCQFVKEFGDEEGGGEEGNFLQTKRFVIFRLCPNNSCGSCNYDYGEYLIDLETYLQATTEYVEEKQEQMCETCNECYENQYNNDGNNDGGDDENAYKCQNIDTSSCYDECQNIENMEDNGYVDASEFVECQALENNNDNGVQYYAGAMCASSGSRIKIGVFTDEDCSTLSEDMEIDSIIYNGDGNQMKLSYHKIKSVFPDSDCVASCLQEDEDQDNNNNDNGEEQQPETAEICRNLYEAAGKCESIHGFSAMKYYNNNDGNGAYYNQVRNEEAVCNYMQNVMSGIYDMSGEISIVGGRSITGGGPATTGGQKFALTFFILGSVGLAGYAAMLHQQLTKGAKANLTNQGGALA